MYLCVFMFTREDFLDHFSKMPSYDSMLISKRSISYISLKPLKMLFALQFTTQNL